MIFPSTMALSAQISGCLQLYMTCVPEGNKRAGYLVFDLYAEVPSLISRFVVERGKEPDLVHIRSCYKNKYLCRTTTSGSYIVASGSGPVEDKKAVNCTLFRVKEFSSQVVTFTHIQSGYELTSFPDDTWPQYLITGGTNALQFTVVTYNVLARLPRRVIFKGYNGNYLRCRWQAPDPIISPDGFPIITFDEHEFNEFTSTDGSDRSAHYEITHLNGTIRVKSVEFGKFWRRNRTYDSCSIWSDSTDASYYSDTLFKVENFGNNVIALRNIGNDKVCKPSSDELLKNLLLKAVETYTVPETYLEVEEPVKYRIIDAQYKFEDARITSQRLKDCSFIEETNPSKTRDSEISDSYEYQKSRSTTWNSSTTITKKVYAEVNFKLPKYIDGQLQLTGESVNKTDLEKGSISSEKAIARCKIRVPPMTKAILRRYVMEVSYDIPFSYIQTDKYTTGEEAKFVVDAGICQGFEAYGFKYVPEFTPL